MKSKTNIISFLTAGAAAMLLSACNGIFSDIYDNPESETTLEYGFLQSSTANSPGKIYIDATDYTTWTYVNFRDKTILPLSVDASEPDMWDFAVHRYDTKTNGGGVAETGTTGFTALESFIPTSDADYIADQWTTKTIVTDMSTMMDGYLSYAESNYNTELSKWLNVDTSTMPPLYTPSNKVYILRLSDGTKAALRLDNYMDASGIKGYMTIEYIYPLND